MSLEYFEFSGIKVCYQDRGQGTPVIMVHCSSATHKEWKAVPEVLPGYRLLAPDLIGYGDTQSWPEPNPLDSLLDVHMLVALMQRIGQAVHLIGHSYGGEVCLEAARLHPDRVISLCLIEPVAFHLLHDSSFQSEWLEALNLANSVITAVEKNQIRKAARRYMGYWLGGWVWFWMPRRQKQGVLNTMQKVAKEFSIISQIRVAANDYGNIAVPVSLIYGENTKQPPKAIIKLLEDLLPDSQTFPIEGAGHMSPFTHPKQVNLLIQQHFSKLN